jgi:hypothetical protein
LIREQYYFYRRIKGKKWLLEELREGKKKKTMRRPRLTLDSREEFSRTVFPLN